ncbi:MAG: exodeoxyribonuclease VII large subunit, partial [Bacteroidales bacterium]
CVQKVLSLNEKNLQNYSIKIYNTHSIIHNNSLRLDFMGFTIQNKINKIIMFNNNIVSNYSLKIDKICEKRIETGKHNLITLKHELHFVVEKTINKHNTILSHFQTLIELNNPQRILDKGYSITRDETGKIIKNSNEISSGDILKTTLSVGEVTSKAV